jgi:hypothetical protein
MASNAGGWPARAHEEFHLDAIEQNLKTMALRRLGRAPA